jgi:hypothetical protein
MPARWMSQESGAVAKTGRLSSLSPAVADTSATAS